MDGPKRSTTREKHTLKKEINLAVWFELFCLLCVPSSGGEPSKAGKYVFSTVL